MGRGESAPIDLELDVERSSTIDNSDYAASERAQERFQLRQGYERISSAIDQHVDHRTAKEPPPDQLLEKAHANRRAVEDILAADTLNDGQVALLDRMAAPIVGGPYDKSLRSTLESHVMLYGLFNAFTAYLVCEPDNLRVHVRANADDAQALCGLTREEWVTVKRGMLGFSFISDSRYSRCDKCEALKATLNQQSAAYRASHENSNGCFLSDEDAAQLESAVIPLLVDILGRGIEEKNAARRQAVELRRAAAMASGPILARLALRDGQTAAYKTLYQEPRLADNEPQNVWKQLDKAITASYDDPSSLLDEQQLAEAYTIFASEGWRQQYHLVPLIADITERHYPLAFDLLWEQEKQLRTYWGGCDDLFDWMEENHPKKRKGLKGLLRR